MLTMFLQTLAMLQLHVFEVESFRWSVVTALCLWFWFLVRFRHKKHSVGVKKTSYQAVMTGQYHIAQSDTTVNIPDCHIYYEIWHIVSHLFPSCSFTHSTLCEVDSFHTWLVSERPHTVRHWNGSLEDTVMWCALFSSQDCNKRGKKCCSFFIVVTNTFIHWLKISM